jgi:hypothetical protein
MGGEICHFDLLGFSGRTCMILAAVFLRASLLFAYRLINELLHSVIRNTVVSAYTRPGYTGSLVLTD